jgi:hypothetical protein
VKSILENILAEYNLITYKEYFRNHDTDKLRGIPFLSLMERHLKSSL